MDMLKRPNDIVRVTQITNHHFRVNTLSPFHPVDRVMETFRITKSQFLHVEDRLGDLVINDQTRKSLTPLFGGGQSGELWTPSHGCVGASPFLRREKWSVVGGQWSEEIRFILWFGSALRGFGRPRGRR